MTPVLEGKSIGSSLYFCWRFHRQIAKCDSDPAKVTKERGEIETAWPAEHFFNDLVASTSYQVML
jgi:hypothetical protein